MLLLHEVPGPSDPTRPYRQYISDVLAEAQRRMLPYPEGDGDGEDAFKALQAAVAPVDPSAFRASVEPLISLYAVGVDEYPDEVLERDIEQLILAAAG